MATKSKPPKKSPSVPLNVRLASSIDAKLRAIAARKGLNRSAVVQLAIAEYVERNGGAQ